MKISRERKEVPEAEWDRIGHGGGSDPDRFPFNHDPNGNVDKVVHAIQDPRSVSFGLPIWASGDLRP